MISQQRTATAVQKSLRLVAITVLAALAIAATGCQAQDYDGEAETAITGLGGLSGLSGFSGLSALANGVVTGYAPMNGNGDDSDGIIQGGGQQRGGLGASESSDDSSSGDYDDDSNDSSASEDHPILSKFFNLISGGARSKRSVDSSSGELAAAADQVASANHLQQNHRVKRGYKGWVPYVSTYVKTDKKANFKWGVKAKVGKKYGK